MPIFQIVHTKPRVLVVEDEPDLRQLLRDQLEPLYTVDVAANGLEALEYLTRFTPSVVLTDLQMPKMGGLDFLAQLRKNGSLIPVVVLTGYGDAENRSTAWGLGAFDFLDKPYSSEQLHHVLRIAVEFGPSFRTMACPEGSPREASVLIRLPGRLLDEIRQVGGARSIPDTVCVLLEEALTQRAALKLGRKAS